MPLTEIPHREDHFRQSTLITHQISDIMKRTELDRYPNCYFLASCDFPVFNFEPSVIVTALEDFSSIIDRQFGLISLTKSMFPNATQLSNQDLAILNKVTYDQFSKTPTRL